MPASLYNRSNRGGVMSSVLEVTSATDLNADLEKRILRLLERKRTASAKEIISTVMRESKNRFLTSAPIVAAIWSLDSQNRIVVTGDWKVRLRKGRPLQTRPTAPKR